MPKSSAKAVKTTKPTIKVGGFKISTSGKSSVLVIIMLASFVVGVVAGGFVLQALTKNDCFEMVAYNAAVDIEIGGEGNPENYEELGVRCISFGQDVADSISIKYLYREDMTHDTCEVNGIDVNVDGIYYVVYTSSNIKYRTVQLIRNVTVLRSED